MYRAEWRMPCAVKKMKGRISKEQMTEFVREVLPLSLLDVACMHARSCACMHGSRGKWGPCLHGSKRSLPKGACHHAMPPHAGIAPACLALPSLLPSCKRTMLTVSARPPTRTPCQHGKPSANNERGARGQGEMMRSLKHPGIVKLLGVCVENGSFYLVQEIVNGYGNLFDFLHKKNQRLTYWQCVQIAVGICDAMAYLHERHIVHRSRARSLSRSLALSRARARSLTW